MPLLRLTLILWVMSVSAPVFGDTAVTSSAVTATPAQLHRVAAATGSVARRDVAARATDLPDTANLPETQGRSGWLMAVVAVVLVGYQLRRKHRFLRPHRFTDL
jgi:hypothetical protein